MWGWCLPDGTIRLFPEPEETGWVDALYTGKDNDTIAFLYKESQLLVALRKEEEGGIRMKPRRKRP